MSPVTKVLLAALAASVAIVIIHDSSPGTGPPPLSVQGEFSARWPQYASAFTNDEDRNRCVVNTSNSMRATKGDDNLKAGVQVCDAARGYLASQRQRQASENEAVEQRRAAWRAIENRR